MPPKTGTTAGLTLTERQMRVISMAFASFESEPKVDYEKMATLLNLGSKASAAARYGEAKKALKEFAAEGGVAASTAATTPDVASSSKKGGKKRVADFDGDDDMEETPTKKKAARKAKGKKVEKDDDTDAEDNKVKAEEGDAMDIV